MPCSIVTFVKFVVFREVLVYQGKESASDNGADVFAEWGLYQCCSVFFVWQLQVVRNEERTDIHICRVLFDMWGRLDRRTLCWIKRDDSRVDAGGYVLCGDWWVDALAVDVLYCGVRICEGLVGAFVQVESDIQEVDDLFVGFDGDPQPIVIKD